LSVHDFFTGSHVNLKDLSAYLDQLSHRARVREARGLTAKEQSLLFDAAEGFLPLTVSHFVPEAVPPMKQVIHYGRNSLPLFKFFQKRFCRAAGEYVTPPLWGYNEQLFKPLTGPGYFTARQADPKEVVIDYFEVPPQRPPGWPRILPNSAKLSRFIYYQTRDYMRGVSKHVSVGRASRNGKEMNNWFVLCREDR